MCDKQVVYGYIESTHPIIQLWKDKILVKFGPSIPYLVLKMTSSNLIDPHNLKLLVQSFFMCSY